MWSLLTRRVQLIIIVAAALVIHWAANAAYALSTGSELGVLQFVALIATLIGIVLVGLFNACWQYIWRRVPFLGRAVFPDLNGTWTGHIKSTWVNPETNQMPDPIPITVVIRQTLLTVSVTLKTRESMSFSTRVFLEAFKERGCYRVWYSYNNDPQAEFRHRSSPHEGVAFLELEIDTNPTQLTGRYYTARRTTGDMVLDRTAK